MGGGAHERTASVTAPPGEAAGNCGGLAGNANAIAFRTMRTFSKIPALLRSPFWGRAHSRINLFKAVLTCRPIAIRDKRRLALHILRTGH